MYLFFDTETTRIPKNYKAPANDLENWPRLVQLGYLMYSKTGKLIASGDYIVLPKGFSIPVEASKVHGITTEIAIKEGKEINIVLEHFYSLVERADFLVAHNMAFDEKIIGADLLRNKFQNIIEKKFRICTMLTTVDYCAIPGPYGNKWPKLSELHLKLLDVILMALTKRLLTLKPLQNVFGNLLI
jgi:DNA polymerase III subunit epsilon